MKKIFISLGVIITAYCSLTAQEAKGKYTLDFNINPAALFDANAGAMFQMPNIKGRYFMASDIAVRLELGMGFNSDKDFTDAEGDDYIKNSSTSITFSPGIEKQFGSEKFVGYIGAELPITNYSEKSEVKIGTVVTNTKNPNGNGNLGIGLNAVFGFDYYLLGNVYVGAEFSPGLRFRKYYDTVMDDITNTKGGTGLSFYLSSSSGIRLGVRF